MQNKINIYEKITLDLGFEDEEKQISDKYVKKISIPHYEPNQKFIHIFTLVDCEKTNKLINKINNSNVSEEEKRFLRFAAQRHLVFNYSRIADYYCNASKEMQELMEESALVIIDLHNAIANGYAKLTKNIEEIMISTGKQASEEYHNQTTPKGEK